MSLLSTFYGRVVWPATDRDYRGFAARFARWRQAERRSLAENRERQWQALRRLLRHAYASSRFYRERFRAAGLDPETMRDPAELSRVPVLTREDLRRHLSDIVSDRYPRAALCEAATGGTTDTPVPLYRDRAGVREKRTAQDAFNLWAGLRPGDRALWLWGARQDYAEHPSWRWRLYDRHLMRRIFLPTSRLGAEVFEGYRQQLNRFRPRVIVAYPTPLDLFCEYLEACGHDHWRPHSAICTAEALLPRQRERIERALGCRVFEQYGSREFAMIGSECEAHNGMHLNPLAAYVEYRPLGGSPAAGAAVAEVLVTDLLNYGMPLIRYQINDCATEPLSEGGWTPCPCGRGYPHLAPVTGRTGDVFRLADGGVVPGVALTNRVLQVVPGLAKTQIMQETLSDFRLRYVPGPGFRAADLELLRGNLARFLPSSLRWTFEAVTEIPREASGKTRFCISKVTAADVAAAGAATEARA